MADVTVAVVSATIGCLFSVALEKFEYTVGWL